jgi:hypothetical protein
MSFFGVAPLPTCPSASSPTPAWLRSCGRRPWPGHRQFE